MIRSVRSQEKTDIGQTRLVKSILRSVRIVYFLSYFLFLFDGEKRKKIIG